MCTSQAGGCVRCTRIWCFLIFFFVCVLWQCRRMFLKNEITSVQWQLGYSCRCSCCYFCFEPLPLSLIHFMSKFYAQVYTLMHIITTTIISISKIVYEIPFCHYRVRINNTSRLSGWKSTARLFVYFWNYIGRLLFIIMVEISEIPQYPCTKIIHY